MLADHLAPWAASHRERGFDGEIGQILVTPKKMAEALRAPDTPRGSRETR